MYVPVVISPMYLVPILTQMVDTGDCQAPKGMRYCRDKSECWHRRRLKGVLMPPRVENRNVTWLVSNSSGFDRAIWRLE